MTAPQPVPGSPATTVADELHDLSRGAVDVYDVAARLEASGVSDRTAAGRYGPADVFALAALLHRNGDGDAAGTERVSPPLGLGEALSRAGLLLAGALLAVAALAVLGLGASVVWAVGTAGWVGGQAVAAVAWSHLGRGQGATGLRRGTGAALVVLALAPLVPLPFTDTPATALLGAAVCLLWVTYACTVSLLVCSGRTGAALLTVLAGLLLAGLLLGTRQHWAGTAVLVVTSGTVLVVAGLTARAVPAAGRPALPRRTDLGAAAPAVGQSVLLAASLLMLLQTVPPPATAPVVLATVVGAATADPAIALLRRWLRSSAARVYVLSVAARRARWAAVVAAAGTALVSAMAAVAVVAALGAGTFDWAAAAGPAAAFTSMSTTSAALTAFGVPWRAVVAAGLAWWCALVLVVAGAVAVAVVLPLSLLGAVALLLHRVSDPRAVA